MVTGAVAGAGTAAALDGHRPSQHLRHLQRANPAHNIKADPSYGACYTSKSSKTCISLELAAINNARKSEHVKPMVLPSDFAKLSSAKQTFVVTNLERTARGLRPFVALVPTLDSVAAVGADHQTDPYLVGWRVGSAQAWKWTANQATDLNALAADYDYMYNDGYSSTYTTNLDCTSPTGKWCWVHRRNILEHYHQMPLLIAGVAEVGRRGMESSAMIMVGASGRSPAPSFTWRAAKQ